jgi:hypothetical protein
MALSTYSELQTAIASWYNNRTDLPVADLITLAEAKIATDLQMSLVERDSTLSSAPSSRFIDLPAGTLEPIALFIDRPGSGREALTFVQNTMETWEAEGEPTYWTIDTGRIAFERPCDQAYALTFRNLARLALSDGSPTNAILTAWPNVYLYACLREAAIWTRDAEKVAGYGQLYADAVTAANWQEARNRAPAKLRVDPAIQPAAMDRGGGFNIYRGW